MKNWAAHPWKQNPAKRIPADIKNETADSLADVFFLHPTTYTGKKEGWNADINDVDLNNKTDNSTILYQASAFNQHCRVFAPRYRQAHLSAFYVDTAIGKVAFDTAYADLKNAFLYYLKNYNKGRPVIIAGHSQGAKMAERLLKEFFDGQRLQKQLVAAYIIGMDIPKDLFQNIPICNAPSQTGCFCGWRTFKKDYVPEYVTKEKSASYITNPLTWKTDDSYAPQEENKGSVLRDFDKIILHATDAQIHDDVLWVNKPKFPGSVFFVSKNYHIADINLFYMNIRANVEERINAYLKKQ